MILSDRDILDRIETGDLSIDPFDRDNVEPSSVDLRLGDEFKKVKPSHHLIVDTEKHSSISEDSYEHFHDSVRIGQNDFVLASTKERVTIPDDLVAQVLGRSSIGRLGITIHQTAGFIDPGFEGQITLELSNQSPHHVTLHKGDRIGQIVFSELSSAAMNPYGHEGSQYQNQSGATESRMDFE